MMKPGRDQVKRIPPDGRDLTSTPHPHSHAFLRDIMTILANQIARLAELRAASAALHAQRGALLDLATAEKRGLTPAELAGWDALTAQREASESDVAATRERVSELTVAEQREGNAARSRVELGQTGPMQGGATHIGGGETYHRGNTSPSFFKDLWYSQRGDANAADRLRRNNSETGLEARALGNTGAAGGAGGEFAPPAWLVQEYVKLARAGRVTADLFHHEPLPLGVSTVNLPKVATGTSTAVQATQNTALSQTDLTSTSLASGVSTIGGKQVVSQQLIDQSGIAFDKVLLEDLTADFSRQLGTQALTGLGTGGQLRGFLTPSSASVLTWTTATPTATAFYGRLAQLQGTINGTRFKAPDAVVMHPRRWAWFASYVDTAGRPLVAPTAGGFNVMANPDAIQGVGHVGSVLGMDVFTDANIPTNLGTGTNQDIVLMMPRDDIWLFESDLRAEAFTAPYADTLAVLFRVFNYSAQIPDRYLASLGQISGTALVTPVFA
jgi:HK97 family phage major capsid protein